MLNLCYRTKATALEKLEVQFAAEYRRHLQTERGHFLCKVANKVSAGLLISRKTYKLPFE